MLETLLPYYERELSFLREHAGRFAARNPKIARRLLMDQEQCEDPHVQRLMEGFAFLAARVHRRLDDDYPEVAEAFLQVLYPHYIRPIPAASIACFLPEGEKTDITGRYGLPRHTVIQAPAVQGVECTFRTCYHTELWPIRVSQARLSLAVTSEHLRRTSKAQAVITLDLVPLPGQLLSGLAFDHLRFFLDGDPGLVSLLYELIFSQTMEVRITDGSDDPARAVHLPPSAIRPVGFEPDEALLEQDPRSLQGYRLLSEVFTFPEKFHFMDITGLGHPNVRECAQRLRIQIHLAQYGDSEQHARLVEQLGAANFKLGCAPIINLFPCASDPIHVTHQKASYPIRAHQQNASTHQIYSIDAVTHSDGPESGANATPVPPFYAPNHEDLDTPPRYFWYATREPSLFKQDEEADMELTLVDLDFKPVRSGSEILSLSLRCTNREWPAHIPFGGGSAAAQAPFTLPGHTLLKHTRLLRKPTPSIPPPRKRGHHWRLISHLTLNQSSLVTHGKEALQALLQLYNHSQSALVSRQIQGIHSLETRPGHARMPGPDFSTFVRGLDVELTFDEACYTGSNLFLFATVLERFLAHSCPPNSFIRFHMFTRQREGEVGQWPARVGDTPLI